MIYVNYAGTDGNYICNSYVMAQASTIIVLKLYCDTLSNYDNNCARMHLGSGISSSMYLDYIYHSTAANSYAKLGVDTQDIQYWYKDRVTIDTPLTVNGNLTISSNTGTIYFGPSSGGSDAARIYYNESTSNAGYLEIATGDDGNEPIYIRQYMHAAGIGSFATLQRTLTLLDASGNTKIPGTLTVPSITLNNSKIYLYDATITDETERSSLSLNFGPENNVVSYLRCRYKKVNNQLEGDLLLREGGSNNCITIDKNSISFVVMPLSNASIPTANLTSSGLTIAGTCTATSHPTSSDRRLKENITELTDEENIIDNVKVYSFNLINEEPQRKHYGVIAQELQEIAPELIYSDNTNEHYLSVNYTELIPHLINKIKQQDRIIQTLSNKLDKIFELLDIKE